jgi:hypothetical protein
MDGKLFKTTYQQRKGIFNMKINKNKQYKKYKNKKRPTMQKRNKSQK